MNNWWVIWIESNLTFSLLFGFYWLFLRNLTFYKLNRVWLLAIIPLSILIPQIDVFPYGLEQYLTQNVDIYVAHENELIVDSSSERTQEGVSINWSEISFRLYSFVSTSVLLVFIMQLLKLLNLKRRLSITRKEKYTFVFLPEGSASFSFFNNIFIPHSYFLNGQFDPVVEHEKVHAKQKHSLDLLLAECFKACMWLNPLVYIMSKEIKTIHEYLVDEELLKKQVDLHDYVDMLMNHVFAKNIPSLVNGFKGSILKKRIIMMTSNPSKKYNKWLYLGILPMVLVLIFAFGSNGDQKDHVPMISPVKQGGEVKITSGFGMRRHPISKERKMHTGVDLKAPIGTPVFATANGIVIKKDIQPDGYGKMIVVQHGKTYQTVYSQLSAFNVEAGDKVEQGQKIGAVGSSGRSTGPHLHYEVIKDGKKVNPQEYFQ